MPWFKVDDNLALHPKVLAAGNSAMGLWIRAGSWAAAQQTDGYIPNEIVRILGGKPSDCRRLTEAGLWHKDGTGYQFHDWQDYQPAKDDPTTHSNRGALGAHNRWHKTRPSPTCPYCTGQNLANGSANSPAT